MRRLGGKAPEALCQEVVELSPDAIVILQDGVFLFVNPAFTRIFGYDADDVIRGLSFFELVDDADKPVVKQRYEDRLAGKDVPRTFLINLIAKDGHRVYCETSATMFHYGGKPADLVIVRDISERKHTAEDLAAKQRTLELLGELERVIVHPELEHVVGRTLDFLSSVLDTPRISIALFDETREGLIVSDVRGIDGEIPPGKQIPNGKAAPSYVIQTGEELYRPDIENGPLEFEIDALLLQSGVRSDFLVPLVIENSCLGTINLGSRELDGISEESRQLLRLIAPRLAAAIRNTQLFEIIRSNEGRVSAMLDKSEDLVIIANQQGKVTWVSPSVERVRGVTREEFIGKQGYTDEVHPDDQDHLREVHANLLAQPEIPIQLHYRVPQPDGSMRYFEGVATNLIDDPRVSGILVNMRDVTQRRVMEEDAQRRERLESLGLLAGGLAHDFNNLLTAIYGNIDLARRRSEPGSAVTLRLKDAESALLKAQEVTQQLLTFARGGAPIKKTCSVESIVREAAAFALRGSNVRCDIEASESPWLARMDPGQISQVFHNLLINAVQAMPDGGTVNVELDNVVLQSPGGEALHWIRVTVEDQGSGIADDELGRIFDPYFTTKAEGTGLGLSTAYAVVHRHGGRITAHSTEGQGTSFVVELPAEPSGVVEHAEQLSDTPEGRGRVLVMDDEKMVRSVTGEMLRELGYEPTMVESGAQAVDEYRRALGNDERYDLVLLDVTVPGGMGGKEAVEKISEIDPDCAAIVTSGYSHDASLASFREHGFRGALHKPYSIGELAQTMQDALSKDD